MRPTPNGPVGKGNRGVAGWLSSFIFAAGAKNNAVARVTAVTNLICDAPDDNRNLFLY